MISVGGSWTIVLVNLCRRLQYFCIQVGLSMDQFLLVQYVLYYICTDFSARPFDCEWYGLVVICVKPHNLLNF